MFTQNCAALIKAYEGFESKAYPDPLTKAEPYTIGYGFTKVDGKRVKLGDTMSREQADLMLNGVIQKYNDYVNRLVKVPLNQNQEDALTCFVFNIGPTKFKSSTALKRLNRSDYDGASIAMTWWINPGSNVEKGLRKRRQAEKDLFLAE